MKVEEKLAALGLELPNVPSPKGSYIPAQVTGNLVYTAGQTARINEVRRYVGKVGAEVTEEDGYKSARDACLNCLACIKGAIGDLDRVARIVKLTGYVNGAPGFVEHPKIINGASDLLHELYGEKGRHARTAIGTELPFNVSVEVEMIVEFA